MNAEFSEGQLQDLLFPHFSVECVATTCLILASKFDELDDNIPLIADFTRAFAGVFPTIAKKYLLTKRTQLLRQRDLLCCEQYTLGLLQWDLNSTTVYIFIQNFMYQGILFNSDLI